MIKSRQIKCIQEELITMVPKCIHNCLCQVWVLCKKSHTAAVSMPFGFYCPDSARNIVWNIVTNHCLEILSQNFVLKYCHNILSQNIVWKYCLEIWSQNIVLQYCHKTLSECHLDFIAQILHGILCENIVSKYCHKILSQNIVCKYCHKMLPWNIVTKFCLNAIRILSPRFCTEYFPLRDKT